MGPVRLLIAAAAVASMLGGCGGGAAHHTAAPNTAPAPATTTSRQAVRPPPAFASRLLHDHELTGFVITRVSVYRSADAFVSGEQLDPGAATAETRMLTREGFHVAVKEDLDHQGVAGLSLLESFAGPAAARAALQFYVAKFRRLGSGSGGFAFFPVAGVPGAVGFRLGGAGGAGVNVAFADGDYYYLLGEEGSGRGPEASLGSAARRLYHRVHP